MASNVEKGIVCHYEILEIPKEATENEIKRAYKRLALLWHPDKNVNNEEEAKQYFQLVQQAYDVLSDPRERAWYDDHREVILNGGDGSHYKDKSLNVFPYFTTACFKGYGDDPSGFFAVYSNVFAEIAKEDREFERNGKVDAPLFGNSTSDYKEVVARFYDYWTCYSTKKTYAWLEPYDARGAPNRKVAKLTERENKKVRSRAQKERNEEIRNLAMYVRKRDVRVTAYGKVLEERTKDNAKKSEDNRKRVLKEREEMVRQYKEGEWSNFSNVEKDLHEIEVSLNEQFGSDVSSDSEDNGARFNIICTVCNKTFKTTKAFENHEKSKRHQANVAAQKSSERSPTPSSDAEPVEDEVATGGQEAEDATDSDPDDPQSPKESEESESSNQHKTKKLTKKNSTAEAVDTDDTDTDSYEDTALTLNERQFYARRNSNLQA